MKSTVNNRLHIFFLLLTLLSALPMAAREVVYGPATVSGGTVLKIEKSGSLAADESLVFHITRGEKADARERLTELTLTVGGQSGEFYVDFFDRGVRTEEYSERIHFDGAFTDLTLKSTGDKPFSFVKLEVLKLKDGEPYSNQFLDRLHLTTDFRYDFHDCDFETTMGIIDDRNHQYSKNAETWAGPDWDNWESGKYTGSTKVEGITLPDYTMEILDNGQKRQQTHITEHTIYAMPGDIIPLYPYYEMQEWAQNGYLISYSHWYDWKTGGHVTEEFNGKDYRLLDFGIDPSGIIYTDNHGYFGGPGARARLKDNVNPDAEDYVHSADDHEIDGNDYGLVKYRFEDHFRIYTPGEYIAFANMVNSGKTRITAEIMADLDFAGYDVKPIGCSAATYIGRVDGHGHKIFNMKINSAFDGSASGVGMFGVVDDGFEVRNLVIDNTCEFIGSQKTGALIGIINNWNRNLNGVVISNIDVNATVKGTATDAWGMGILFGLANNVPNGVTISNCHIGGSITATVIPSDKTFSAIGQFGNTNPSVITIENVYVDAAVDANCSNSWRYNFQTWKTLSDVKARATNLWSIVKDGCTDNQITGDVNTSDFLSKLGGEFELVDGKLRPAYHKMKFEPIQSKSIPYLRKTYRPKQATYKEGEEEIVRYKADEYELDEYGNPVIGEDGEPVIKYRKGEAKLDENNNPIVIVHKEGDLKFDIDDNPINDGVTEEVDAYRWDRYGYPEADFGTQATFYCPRTSNNELPREYVIAADFGHEFQGFKNIEEVETYDNGLKKERIVEPIVHFRHKFTIKDGKTFADDFTHNNRDYIKKHRVFVTTRAGKDFQLRLENPAPVPGKGGVMTPPSAFYYKAADGSYDRIFAMEIEVTDADGTPVTNHGFEFSETFTVPVARVINGVAYSIYGDENNADRAKYYRMLTWNTEKGGPVPAGGEYTVTIKGLDRNGNSTDLKVMEYVIEFVPETIGGKAATGETASLVSDETLYSKPEYKAIRPEELEKKQNWTLADRKDFDAYRHLNNDTTFVRAVDGHHRYKWPVPLDQSSYSFGYDKASAREHWDHYDFNEYLLADHSSMVPYHGAAGRYPTLEWEMGSQGAGETGLYDRLYYNTRRRQAEGDESVELENGYFYYVNAATDPGVMARLKVQDLCFGSTIHVSAWVAEFSRATYPSDHALAGQPSETANVAFNFIAIVKDKANGEERRVKMHKFVTGYVPWGYPDGKGEGKLDHIIGDCGHWMHVYYSFTPRFADLGINSSEYELLRYELELDNNCKNSSGADYAVDDIVMYVQNPSIEAHQLNVLCKPADALEVRVEADFEVLLQAIGAAEDAEGKGQPKSLYYTFIDKEKFDAAYEAQPEESKDFAVAFESAKVEYKYNGTDKSWYGTLTFKTAFKDNNEYNPNTTDYIWAQRLGTDKIVFNTMPSVSDLEADKDYYIAMVPMHTDDSAPKESEFNIKDHCTLQCIFTVKGSEVIKLDGKVTESTEDRTYCANQTPVVQINLQGINRETGEMEEIPAEKNVVCDWYYGRYSDFMKEYMDGHKDDSKYSLDVILDDFRAVTAFANAASLDGLDEEEVKKFGEDKIAYLRSLTQTTPQKLYLYSKSFVFPPLQEGKKKVYVVALPTDTYEVYEDEYMICAEATEIALNIVEASPEMLHGLTSLTYDDDMTDVPLRASLRQLKAASAARNADGEFTADDRDTHTHLYIPVRHVQTTNENIQLRLVSPDDEEAETLGLDRSVCLVWTDDSRYAHLGSPDELGKEDGLLNVGELMAITAVPDGKGNYFRVLFDNDDTKFQFREGFTYRFRINYIEDNEERNKRCPGQDIFTIKVVPEYLKWTGAVNSNWNNDGNWTRITKDEIKAEQSFSDELFVVAGTNPRKQGFAPLDFTKVIIPADAAKVPHLFDTQTTDKSTDFADVAWPAVKWPADPSTEKEAAGQEGYSYTFTPEAPTAKVQFDMVGYTVEGNADKRDVYCRPWFANTCEEVHFEAGSEMARQQFLTYKNAWVELEVAPHRWYTLSMPLQEVYAGDMYLPKAGSRQDTEYFRPMTFADTNRTYDRFRPAVYQRGWDKSTATVYEIKDGPSRDVAVKAAWSNVYNDVTVAYGAGTGFSIKVDNSEADGTQGNALFRLPKADTAFDYYDKDQANISNNTSITRTKGKTHRLNDTQGTVRAEARAGSRYFLVGNPFMAHLDMAKFLEANSEVISPKYWLITDGTQHTAVWTEGTTLTGDAAPYVAPFQGFFVEALTAPDDGKLELAYNESMSTVKTVSEAPLRAASRAAESRKVVSIEALTDEGDVVSTATIVVDPTAQPGYVESRDAVAFDNTDAMRIPAVVYALADTMATAVTTRRDLEGTGLGLLAQADNQEVITLRFNGIEDMMLYDPYNDSYTPIYDGMTYGVNAPAAGLVITNKTIATEELPLRYSLDGNRLTITGEPDEEISLIVADMTGRVVASPGGIETVTTTLGTGIYVFEAASPTRKLTAKILVK